jgi:serine/threonine-protein kinase
VTKIDDYELVSKLAIGGTCTNWRARQGGREVVLHQLLPGIDRAVVLGGAWLAQRFKHPNLIRVLHVGAEYYVTELVEGGELFRVVRRDRPPPTVAAGIVAQAGRGLHFIHAELKLLHGEVCRDSLMVARDGAALWLGARPMEIGATHATSAFLGVAPHTNLNNLSPEHARGAPLDARHEQFQLGGVLYELLTGHRLWRAEWGLETINAALEGVVSLDEVQSPFVAILERALAKEPAARFPDVAAFAEALAPHAASQAEVAAYVARFL